MGDAADSSRAAPAAVSSPLLRRIPNQLTVLRLVLAGVFFLTLNQYRYPIGPSGWIVAAFFVFIAAAITDWLDGFLARRWHAESTFGRIMDPFCDKVLVIGAFIYLSGPRFVIPDAVAQGEWFTMASGVYPWMVAIILARELLVTGIRDEVESRGVQFGAQLWGKLKAVLQLVAVPVILFIVWQDPRAASHQWMAWLRDTLVYATVIVTVLSGLPYITSAVRAIKRGA
jgi:CDP-diacylglycerol--glycerol-3-phosphate 3-phosphatidyltransferase